MPKETDDQLPDALVVVSKVELRHLEYFLAVVEEGSFTRAAARLYMVQSSLSAALLNRIWIKLVELFRSCQNESKRARL